jgi:formiminotetrahydrofolate cyclodeaminase
VFLEDSRLKEFVNETGSSSPTPGGGSVAAVVLALSFSLSSMVINLTIGKEKYKDIESDLKNIKKKITDGGEKFLELMNDDADNFNALMKVLSSKNDKKIIEAIQNAIYPPLEMMRLADKLFPSIYYIVKNGNKNALSDALISGILLKAGIHAAYLNIKINLNLLYDKKNDVFIKKIIDETKNILKNTENFSVKIKKYGENELGR